jgi:hypothetical protein
LLEITGWRAHALWLDLPTGGVESDHFQVTVPPDVDITEAAIATASPKSIVDKRRSVNEDHSVHPDVKSSVHGFETRVHLYLPRAHDQSIACVWLRLRATRSAFVSGAVITSLVVCLILTFFWRNAHDIVNISEAAAAVLLLVPALIAGFLVRPTDHAMARRLLRFPRLVTTCVAAFPLIAASLLVAVSNTPAPEPILMRLTTGEPEAVADWKLVLGWELLAIAAFVATLLLAVSWIFPRQGRQTDPRPPAHPDAERLQMDAAGRPPDEQASRQPPAPRAPRAVP